MQSDEMSTEQIYAAEGFGGRSGSGERPCLLIVDFSRAFTDPSSPLHCSTEAAVPATVRLLHQAREAGRPVVFTTVQYDEAGREAARRFLEKAPSLAILEPGSRWVEIDERLAPAPGEPVIAKLWASAFFGTPLSMMLTSWACDTLVVCGASTSGCVRASVVDGLQHGFRVIVPRDAVADRAPAAHTATLLDVDAKYGDVVDLATALAALADRG